MHNRNKSTECPLLIRNRGKSVNRILLNRNRRLPFLHRADYVAKFILCISSHNIINNRKILLQSLQKPFCHTAHNNKGQRHRPILLHVSGSLFHTACLCVRSSIAHLLKPGIKTQPTKNPCLCRSPNRTCVYNSHIADLCARSLLPPARNQNLLNRSRLRNIHLAAIRFKKISHEPIL